MRSPKTLRDAPALHAKGLTPEDLRREAEAFLARDRVFAALAKRGHVAALRWWIAMQGILYNARLFSFVSAALLIFWGIISVLSGQTGFILNDVVEQTVFGRVPLPWQGIVAIWVGILGILTAPFDDSWAFLLGIGVMTTFWVLAALTMWPVTGFLALRLPGAMICCNLWALARHAINNRPY